MPEFYMIFARKMPEFYTIIARKKIFFSNFRGHVPPAPLVSYAYAPTRLNYITFHITLHKKILTWPK